MKKKTAHDLAVQRNLRDMLRSAYSSSRIMVAYRVTRKAVMRQWDIRKHGLPFLDLLNDKGYGGLKVYQHRN